MSVIRRKVVCAALLTGTAGSLAGAPALAADAKLTLLTPLSQQSPFLYATAISGDGSTIVGASVASSGYVAPVTWSLDGSVVALNSPYFEGVALGVSQDGGTIVGDGELTAVGDTEAWAYRGGTFTTLPATLFPTVSVAEAVAASADGSVIAGTEGATGVSQAVIWSGANWSTETSLGALAPGDNTTTTGMDGAGTTVVGYDRAPTQGAHESAFYWRSGTISALPFSGFSDTEAHGVSADGSTIVGASSNGPNDSHAVMWSGPGYSVQTELGTLGGDEAGAWAVSGDGSIIVGSSVTAGGDDNAFRYTGGKMSDLNTLLADAGVDMGTIHLTGASAISADGRYIVSDDYNLNNYVVLYDDTPADTGGGGSIGGLSTAAAQQDSTDQVGRDRQSLALRQDSYTSLMLGDFDALSQQNQLGTFALAGSAIVGVRGRGGDEHWTLTGGLAGGSEDSGSLNYNALTGAAALRYSFGSTADSLRPFLEVGGSASSLSGLTFTRTYANGAGTATGVGTTNGFAGTAFARLGVVDRTGPADSIELSAELGERWLNTDAYAETLSTGNPFPAAVGAGTDSYTVTKAAASWTHDISPNVDLTLRGALGAVVGGQSGLQLSASGFGTFTTGVAASKWVEAGARLGWRTSRNTTLDLHVLGTVGEDVPASAEVGAGLRLQF